jgi:hypothetical protein
MCRILCAALAISAVLGLSPSFGQSVSPTILGRGWQCLLIPTSFDEPGTIFSVTNDGEKSRIVDLQAMKLISVQTGKAAFGKVSDKNTIGGGVMIAVLEKSIPDLGLKLSGKGSEIKGATVEYGDVVEETTYEIDTNPVVEKWVKEHITPKIGLRYFLVRDAYVAGDVLYNLSESDIVKIGGEFKFKHLIEGSATVLQRESQSSYQLDQVLTPPLRVCIRASEILPTRDANGVGTYRVSNRTGEVPKITRSLD